MSDPCIIITEVTLTGENQIEASIPGVSITEIEATTPGVVQTAIPTYGVPGPAGPGSTSRRNTVAAASFSGNPKKATVSFATPYADDQYAIAITGADPRIWSYESKTAAGFVINSNSNTAPTGEVSYIAMPKGETV